MARTRRNKCAWATAHAAVLLLLAAVGSHGCGGCHVVREPSDILGKRITEVPTAKSLGTLLMTSPSSLQEAYEVALGGVVFGAAVNAEGTVVYLSTEDTSFETPEGVRVGMPLEQVMPLATGGLSTYPGWAYVVSLPSGWRAAFVRGETMTEGLLLPSDKVRWLFQRTRLPAPAGN